MSKNTRHDTSLRVICAALFATFSFLYIYLFQGELLAQLQDHLSKGATSNNGLLTALIITALLMVLKWAINRISKLHGSWEALSYIPSCALLSLITDINSTTIQYSASRWIWSIVLCTLIYTAIVWIERRTISDKRTAFISQLWPNLMSLTLLFVITAQSSNYATTSHLELSAWKQLHDGNYEKLLKVGQQSDDTSETLTALRSLAMTKTATLPERLFQYPQPYGSEGLIYRSDNEQTNLYGAEEYYKYLPLPHDDEAASAYAKRLYEEVDSAMYRDFYLASLLLDKDLTTFVAEISPSLTANIPLPTYYQEALLLYKDLYPDKISFTADKETEERFATYKQLCNSTSSPIVARNICLRKYGHTYWFYYDFETSHVQVF